MASQADQFYYSQIGCKSQQKHRFCGKSVSRGSRELPRTYGVSYAHNPLCSAAVGPWKQSNLSFLLRHHWVAVKQSRESCPRRDGRTQAGAGLFPTFPTSIWFYIFATLCWRIKGEKIQICWGHLSFCRSQVKCEVTKGKGTLGQICGRSYENFPENRNTIGLA